MEILIDRSVWSRGDPGNLYLNGEAVSRPGYYRADSFNPRQTLEFVRTDYRPDSLIAWVGLDLPVQLVTQIDGEHSLVVVLGGQVYWDGELWTGGAIELIEGNVLMDHDILSG